MRNIMKHLLYTASSLILIALGSCSHPKNIIFRADTQTGALNGLYMANDTSINWILCADGTQYEWVDSRCGWGLGHFWINGTKYFWSTPKEKDSTANRMTVKYQVENIEITVVRTWNEDGNLVESYEFANTGKENASLQEIAINTPFNDNYPDARTCYNARCNAHIWTGGNDAYVYCTRMSGAPGGLGLILQKGAVEGYEISERSEKTGGSNFRGVFQLNPENKILKPGECYTIQWLLLSADNWNDFQTKAIGNGLIIATANRYVVEEGEEVTVSFKSNFPSLKGKLLLNNKEVAEVNGDNINYTTTLNAPGEQIFTLSYDDGKKTSVECLTVSNFDSLINRRCRFIAEHQQFIKSGDPRNGAFIVYDNDTESLYINGESGRERADCDEARERVAMGILLALQYQCTSDKKVKDALNSYVSFVRRIQRADYTTNSTVDFQSYNRGYNYPWVADFWFTMFCATGDRQYLKDGYGTLRALVRYFNHDFYCIGVPTYGYTLLKDNNFTAEADTLLNDFKLMADVFYENGPNYPTFEVNYEQSIVGPSIIHLLNVYMLTGNEKYLKGAESQLPLLESFGGKQPSFHLNDIAIRHWDGYWFGKDQIWGDTFPHYWSTLSGIAFRLYAKATGKQEYAERALNIFRNNFCLFSEDGRGSCAFIYPNKVNGQKAHFYDPFANDQDWAMVHWLKYGPNFV
ncbi:MarR family transcriptional regulator [uncultured Bacteroides sp.]|uniref:MarR family transcriptional regulator n=1 Tax=uncultured Bacteroides sp. TaxID=162156 RepID=UPI00280B3F68|nr:MarR family transcriptional regulator [uncultured Bacteroides sp.]